MCISINIYVYIFINIYVYIHVYIHTCLQNILYQTTNINSTENESLIFISDVEHL